MFVPEKLRLNAFKPVQIPKNSEFVKRYGFVNPSSQSFTGDLVAPVNQSKIDSLIEGERVAEMLNKEDSSKSQ